MITKQLTILVPKLKDPRILFMLFAYSILAYAFLMIPSYGRPLTEYLYVAFWCIIFDLFLKKFIDGTWVVPISGLISSFGIFIVTDVADKKYYILLAFLAIGSKAFFKINGRHVFNPANFAIVGACFGLPIVISNTAIARWDGNLLHSLLIFILGTILAIRVNRWVVALTYIFVSLLLSPIRSYFAHENPLAYMHTLLWPGILIFIFFMTTDPPTSPNRRSYQFIYGAFIAVFVQIIRFSSFSSAAHMIALFIVSLSYALIDKKISDKKIKNEWHTREVHLRK